MLFALQVCGLLVQQPDKCSCWINLPTFKSNSRLIKFLDWAAGVVKVRKGAATRLSLTRLSLSPIASPTRHSPHGQGALPLRLHATHFPLAPCPLPLAPPPIASVRPSVRPPVRLPARLPSPACLLSRLLSRLLCRRQVPSRVTTYLEMFMDSSRVALEHVQVLRKYEAALGHDKFRLHTCDEREGKDGCVGTDFLFTKQSELKQFYGRPPSAAEVDAVLGQL